MPFKSLNSAHIIETLERLADRVRERFPDASLNNVVTEVIDLGKRKIDVLGTPGHHGSGHYRCRDIAGLYGILAVLGHRRRW